MNFYIKKIKLWFSTHSQPIEYEFKKNKVNVVTGDSSTGKSSILRVIDYCLLSKESTIVEDVINENVAWYGLAFHLNGHDYVVARKAPTNGRIGHDFYWADNTDEFPGDDYPRPTQGVSRVEIIDFINSLLKLNPNERMKLEEIKNHAFLKQKAPDQIENEIKKLKKEKLKLQNQISDKLEEILSK